MKKTTKTLAKAFLTIKTDKEMLSFLRDLLTIKEIETLAQRFEVAQLLNNKVTFKEIEKKTKASSATISRVNQWIHYGKDGYKTVLGRMHSKNKTTS